MIDTLLLYLKSYFEETITQSFLNTYSLVILTLKEHYIALPASLIVKQLWTSVDVLMNV